jgi:3-dehydroquinate synthase
MRRVSVRLKAQNHAYQIAIGAGTLSTLGAEARSRLPVARRVALISNKRVFELYGDRVMAGLRDQGLEPASWLMRDGERHKSLDTLEAALDFLSGKGLERNDLVVALGGGVVGDLAGLASALYLRGIAFIQAPTTLLAQIDASVGGKTAVNLPAGKNMVGVFHQPRMVVIDTDTLRTLPRRELTAGWCEAVKQGAAGSRKLFDQTRTFLADSKEADDLEKLIAAQCAFKADIVTGDEREDMFRTDGRSRRILNFGHTTGHALEAVTQYRKFKHGEAVGYGMLVAGEMSKRLGLLPESELESLRQAVGLCGRLPPINDLDVSAVAGALRHDKKSVGGHVKWVLLERLGQAVILDDREIGARILRSSLRAVMG